MKTFTTTLRVVGAFALLLTSLRPVVTFADACPPNESDWVTWTTMDDVTSGDVWFARVWCGYQEGGRLVTPDPALKARVIASVRANMGLDQDWDIWSRFIADTDTCNPRSWGVRLVNAGYFADYVGEQRDNSTLTHGNSPGARMPDGTPVTRWLSQWMLRYAADEGFDFECHAGGDPPGPPRFTFASNPFAGANNLFFPWFWNLNVADRAATLVHEAAHDFSSHIGNDQCGNQGSCDDFYPNANAQTFDTIFNSHAVDAYLRAPGSRELAVANYGNGVCGYIPVLPDQVRFGTANNIQNNLTMVFRSPPPQSIWPASAFLDAARGSIYDRVDDPGGRPDIVYRIDVQNAARWPCDQVCDPADYDAGGRRACDEVRQSANAERNRTNRATCEALNAEARAGTTGAALALLRDRAITEMQSCAMGVSQTYVDAACDEVIGRSSTTADIAANWTLDDVGYGFDAEEAIADCQQRFCDTRDTSEWLPTASAACFEWDDSSQCLAAACGGTLAEVAADHGRDSLDYLSAMVCRQSAIVTGELSFADVRPLCQRQYERCVTGDQYLAAWQEQLASGGECWMGPAGADKGDPLYSDEFKTIGALELSDWLARFDRGSSFLHSSCTLERMACETEQAAVQATFAKIVALQAKTIPINEGDFPRPGDRFGLFDAEVLGEMTELGDLLAVPSTGDEKPLARDGRLARLVAIPEAQVAIADFVGRDTFFGAGGGLFTEGYFAPETLAMFGGVAPEADPYGIPTTGFEAELAALGALAGDLGSGEAMGAFEGVGALQPFLVYGHLEAMLEARTGMELMGAYEALLVDIESATP